MVERQYAESFSSTCCLWLFNSWRMNRFASSQLAFYSPLCVIQDSSLAFQWQSRFLLTPWDQVGRCGTNIAGTNCVIRSIHSFIAKDSHKRKLCKTFSEGRGSHSRHRLRPRTIPIHRVCKRQTQRANIEADSVEDYFCWAVFLPFMDFSISELNRRFGSPNHSAPVELEGPLEQAEAERWKATAPSFETLVEAFFYASKRLFPIATANLKRTSCQKHAGDAVS